MKPLIMNTIKKKKIVFFNIVVVVNDKILSKFVNIHASVLFNLGLGILLFLRTNQHNQSNCGVIYVKWLFPDIRTLRQSFRITDKSLTF